MSHPVRLGASPAVRTFVRRLSRERKFRRPDAETETFHPAWAECADLRNVSDPICAPDHGRIAYRRRRETFMGCSGAVENGPCRPSADLTGVSPERSSRVDRARARIEGLPEPPRGAAHNPPGARSGRAPGPVRTTSGTCDDRPRRARGGRRRRPRGAHPDGAPGRARTCTEPGLSRSPLPVGLRGPAAHPASAAGPRGAPQAAWRSRRASPAIPAPPVGDAASTKAARGSCRRPRATTSRGKTSARVQSSVMRALRFTVGIWARW